MTDLIDARLVNTWESGASFSVKNRLYRIAWLLVWTLMARWTPAPLHKWRRFLLVLFGADIDPTAGVYPSVSIWSPANLRMGRYSFAGPGVQIYNIAPITFEPYSLASQGAYLCTGSHHVDDPNFQLFAKPITLKRRAWIAAEAFVGPGVVVHEGAVLGARGCTTKDLDAWTIYAGNPAKKIRMRNLDATAFQESN